MPSVKSKPPFVAVDWGTSSFRAALVQPSGEVSNEIASPRGILGFKPDEFVPYLRATCASMTQAGGTMFLLSGMIGSKNGALEVPYCPCPTTSEHIAAQLGWVETGNGRPNIAIVPGVRMAFDDVMRGEETQVFGAAEILGLSDGLVVLPGTHSKWVHLERGAIARLKTFMTGEVFALLANHSILSKSLPDQAAGQPQLDTDSFLEGVDRAHHDHARGQNLLGNAFSTRVKFLFNALSPEQASSYLSGLVIGDELACQQLETGSKVVVVGAPALCERYRIAFHHLKVVTHLIGNAAAWAGLHRIYQRIQYD